MIKTQPLLNLAALTAGSAMLCGMLTSPVQAQECGDDGLFGECRVLVEINATDGDVGFHWLADGDDLNATRIDSPNGEKVFENGAFGPLREQKLTESFGESAEPPCWDQEGEADEDEIVTLRDFREMWAPGTYAFRGKGDEGEKSFGEAELSYYLPAAPMDVQYEGGVISWAAGEDLGNCTPKAPDSLDSLLADGVIAELPGNVPVIAFEVVMEPDVDDGDWRSGLVFKTRIAGDQYQVTVPADYLASLGPDTPMKIEVGAIGGDFEIDDEGEIDGDADNATFTETEPFCVNEAEGCELD